MNLLNLILNQNSELLSNIKSLEEILDKNKYFAIGHILKSKIDQQTNFPNFDKSISKASIYSIDRSNLFEYIFYNEYVKIPELKPKPIANSTAIVDLKTDEKVEIETKINIVDSINGFVEEEISNIIPIVYSQKPIKEGESLADSEKQKVVSEFKIDNPSENENEKIEEKVNQREILVEKPKRKNSTKIKEENIEVEAKVVVQKEVKKIKSKAKEEIIETFIKNNPGISRPTDKDYTETVQLANKSLEENLDIVSETLAEIYLQQGNKEKAIKIFKQLILNYPEKKRYFAAQIKKIE
jgi:hypothetical protein